MFALNKIQLFLFINLFLIFFGFSSTDIPVLTPGHGVIGDYPKMNMKTCGFMAPETTILGVEPNAEVTQLKPQSRIIDGVLAQEGEFPWMANILYFNTSWSDPHLCAGTLIHRYWVLTVKHCVFHIAFGGLDAKLLKIYLGSLDIYDSYSSYDALFYVVHPNWDLALIRLVTEALPVVKNGYYLINYICLPKERILNTISEEAIVCGFGQSNLNNQPLNSKLRKTTLYIDPYYDCMKRNYSMVDICAIETVHMLCFGDSGAPLAQFDGNRSVLIGVNWGGKSWDPNLRCGPGYVHFHRISHFIDWIKYWVESDRKPIDTTPVPTVPIESTISTIDWKTSTLIGTEAQLSKSYQIFRIDLIIIILIFILYLF